MASGKASVAAAREAGFPISTGRLRGTAGQLIFVDHARAPVSEWIPSAVVSTAAGVPWNHQLVFLGDLELRAT